MRTHAQGRVGRPPGPSHPKSGVSAQTTYAVSGQKIACNSPGRISAQNLIWSCCGPDGPLGRAQAPTRTRIYHLGAPEWLFLAWTCELAARVPYCTRPEACHTYSTNPVLPDKVKTALFLKQPLSQNGKQSNPSSSVRIQRNSIRLVVAAAGGSVAEGVVPAQTSTKTQSGHSCGR